MSKVIFHELSKDSKLRQLEAQVNRDLASALPSRPCVMLFQNAEGQVGYSVTGVPVEGGRAILDHVHRRIRKVLKLKRGRPISEPKRQVKVWISESKYRLLAKKASQQSISPSRLAGEFVSSKLP